MGFFLGSSISTGTGLASRMLCIGSRSPLAITEVMSLGLCIRETAGTAHRSAMLSIRTVLPVTIGNGVVRVLIGAVTT